MRGCNINADIRIPHLYGFGFSDHRHVSYYTYRLIASVLTMLLVYSLSMSNKNLSTSAFGACSSEVLLRPYLLHSRKNRLPDKWMRRAALRIDNNEMTTENIDNKETANDRDADDDSKNSTRAACL
jgi:hypothetical protein